MRSERSHHIGCWLLEQVTVTGSHSRRETNKRNYRIWCMFLKDPVARCVMIKPNKSNARCRDSWGTAAIIQVRDSGGLGQSLRREDDKK